MNKRLERTSDAHDFPLDFHWKTDPAFVARAGVSLTGNRKAATALASIMSSVVLAAAAQAGGWVSYSRNTNFYAGLARYEGTSFTFDRVLAAVEKLKGMGLIEEDRALPHAGGSGWQSRIRATDALVYAFEGASFEPVIHSVLRMRDDDGRLVDYTDTQATRRMTRTVEGLNEALRPIRITLPEGDGWEHRDGHVLARSEKPGGGWAMVRAKPHPYLIRSFSRNSWACHGRLYGWWQLLPAARRAEMLIDGEAVVEHDYSCLHGTLLYAKVGLKPDGDIYRVPGYEHLRKACKNVLNTGFNTVSFNETVWSLLRKNEKRPGSWPHSHSETVKIVRAVEARNEPIRRFIGSDAGIALMKTDSDMAIQVMKRCARKGIKVLPVHDSFSSQQRHGDTVRSIMDEVLEETCNAISPSKRTVIGQIFLQVEGPVGGGPVPEGRVGLSSPGVVSPAELVVAPVREGLGFTPPRVVTPCPEAPGGLSGVGTAIPPLGVAAPDPEGRVVSVPLLAVPVPRGSFRPVVLVRPSLRPSSLPLIAAAAPSPAVLAPPAPVPDAVPSSRPPFPAFLQSALDETRAEVAAAAAAAARAREIPPPLPPARGGWAPSPVRKDSPAPVPVVAPASRPAPVPAPEPSRRPQVDQFATLGACGPVPSLTLPQRPMTREESSRALRAVAEKVRLHQEERRRQEARQRFR